MSGLASDGEDEFKPFRYRRIRRIVCKRCSPDRISMECDCGFFERTCVICRHLLKLLKVVLGSWGFDTQQWHRSLLKKFYNDVLLTSKNVGGSKKIPLPTIPVDAFEQWLRAQAASTEGVPSEGLFVEDGGNIGDDNGFGNDAPEDSVSHKRQRRPSDRGQRTEEECQTKFQTIMFMCKRNPVLRTSFYDCMCDWQEAAGRGQQLRHPGPGESARTRGPADRTKGAKRTVKRKTSGEKGQIDKGSTAKKRQKVSTTEPSGLEGIQARRYIKKFGAKEGWVVEVLNDQNSDRWFMLVENGFTYPKPHTGDILIKACKWFKANSVTELQGWKTSPCDVETITGYGPPEYFNITQVEHPAAPKTAAKAAISAGAAAAPTHFGGGSAAVSSKRTTDSVNVSSDSDDSDPDAPISKEAIKMAKASAAAAKAAAAQKPEQPKVTTKQVVAHVQRLQAPRTSASGDSDPPIKNKKGMICINGEWHIQ